MPRCPRPVVFGLPPTPVDPLSTPFPSLPPFYYPLYPLLYCCTAIHGVGLRGDPARGGMGQLPAWCVHKYLGHFFFIHMLKGTWHTVCKHTYVVLCSNVLLMMFICFLPHPQLDSTVCPRFSKLPRYFFLWQATGGEVAGFCVDPAPAPSPGGGAICRMFCLADMVPLRWVKVRFQSKKAKRLWHLGGGTG